MGVSDRRLTLIYYGPDERKFDRTVYRHDLRAEYGWASDAPLIGMVAYFYPKLRFNRWTPPAQGHSNKRQEDLIRAVPRVLAKRPKSKVPPCRFRLGGRWTRAYGANAATRRGTRPKGQRHIYWAFVQIFPQCYAHSTLRFKLDQRKSRWHNRGATDGKCPTIATRSGGMTDSVIDGVTGVLVNPCDPASLADGHSATVGRSHSCVSVRCRGQETNARAVHVTQYGR